jgi:hypothetical protein
MSCCHKCFTTYRLPDGYWDADALVGDDLVGIEDEREAVFGDANGVAVSVTLPERVFTLDARHDEYYTPLIYKEFDGVLKRVFKDAWVYNRDGDLGIWAPLQNAGGPLCFNFTEHPAPFDWDEQPVVINPRKPALAPIAKKLKRQAALYTRLLRRRLADRRKAARAALRTRTVTNPPTGLRVQLVVPEAPELSEASRHESDSDYVPSGAEVQEPSEELAQSEELDRENDDVVEVTAQEEDDDDVVEVPASEWRRRV